MVRDAGAGAVAGGTGLQAEARSEVGTVGRSRSSVNIGTCSFHVLFAFFDRSQLFRSSVQSTNLDLAMTVSCLFQHGQCVEPWNVGHVTSADNMIEARL